jgi:hypothetical protein
VVTDVTQTPPEQKSLEKDPADAKGFQEISLGRASERRRCVRKQVDAEVRNICRMNDFKPDTINTTKQDGLTFSGLLSHKNTTPSESPSDHRLPSGDVTTISQSQGARRPGSGVLAGLMFRCLVLFKERRGREGDLVPCTPPGVACDTPNG